MNPIRAFREEPLSAIHPEGWLRRYLELQRHGLTGHMEAAGYPFDTDGWADPAIRARSGDAWWPYEQTGYWVDGALRCGHLLRDPGLIEKAGRQVEFVLNHAQRDGYLGPAFLKRGEHWCRWPHAVFFRALAAHASATGDRGIADAVARHYLRDKDPYTLHRNVVNVESMLWAYEQTGQAALLERALAAYEGYNRRQPDHDTAVPNMLSDRVGTEHGVTYNEIGKLGAIVGMHSGHRRLLDATENAYHKLDRDQMLIDGLHSCTERLRGRDPLDSHETCDVADYTWSLGYLLMATGRAAYADKIERACFNAAPGAVRTHDFGALQYFSCPNQIVADKSSNHNAFFRGDKWMSYRPNPGTECCPGEVNRILPNYAARMWMRDGRGGIVAALYGPSRLTTTVGPHRQAVTLVEETAYPFGERIDFQVRTSQSVKFPFTVRIPGWCTGARLLLNGAPLGRAAKAGRFVTIEREFAPNDRITVELPMTLALSRWAHGGVGIERGPLVFALRIEEDWQIDRTEKRATRQFPAWNLYPASDWNYALDIVEGRLAEDVAVVERPVASWPWTIDAAPVELRVPARKVAGWKMIHTSSVLKEAPTTWTAMRYTRVRGDFRLTPQLPNPDTLRRRLGARTETVRLVPYGCTHLRLAIFPDAARAK